MEQTPPLQLFEITLLEKHHEHGDVYTFVFKTETPIVFQAGQYVHMKLANVPEGQKSVREFSFASAPGDETLWFTVNTKSGSPYQEALKTLAVGEKVSLFKIKGHMTVIEKEGTHLVLIGGGVGVAPFRSILRDLSACKVPTGATLVQVDRGEYLYEKELSLLPYEQHRIMREEVDATLEEVGKKHPSAMYYVAGSPVFVFATRDKLLALGIALESIQTDIFNGLKDD